MRALCLLAFVTVIAGCAAVTRVEPGSGSQLAVKGRTYDEVWRAAISVVGHNLSIGAGTNKERGEIQAGGGTSRLLPGEAAVGVFIRPANTPSEQYTVEVVSRKRGVVALIGKNWEQTIIDGLKAELKL